MKGQITIGKHTSGHGEWLKGKGYSVVEAIATRKKKQQDGSFKESQIKVYQVEVTGFIEGTSTNPFDLGQDAIATLKRVVEEKKAFTYETRIKFPDGQVYFGTPACTKLGPCSALIMSPVKESQASKPKTGFDF